jgi:hypothetical protein
VDVAYLNGRVTALAVRTALLLSLSLGGCATSSLSLMDARAETLTQQKYLPLEDLPSKREKPALTVDEWAARSAANPLTTIQPV